MKFRDELQKASQEGSVRYGTELRNEKACACGHSFYDHHSGYDGKMRCTAQGCSCVGFHMSVHNGYVNAHDLVKHTDGQGNLTFVQCEKCHKKFESVREGTQSGCERENAIELNNAHCKDCGRLADDDELDVNDRCKSCRALGRENALTKCPKCGGRLTSDDPSCPKCGYEITEKDYSADPGRDVAL